MKLIMSSLYPQQIKKKKLLDHRGDLTVGNFILVLHENESEKKKEPIYGRHHVHGPPGQSISTCKSFLRSQANLLALSVT